MFQYLLSALNTLSLAYVHTGNFNDSVKFAELNDDTMSHFIRTHYQGNVIGCGSYSPESASLAIENNQFDLIAFGRPFIANPDLIQKLRQNLPLTAYDASMLATLN